MDLVRMGTKDEMISNAEDRSALKLLFIEIFYWLGKASENPTAA